MKVLIVMPDMTTAVKMYERLRQNSHRVIITGSSKDAGKIVSHGDFELAFIHLSLPDGDGLELIKNLKDKRRRLRVVAVTTDNSRLKELSARKLGVIYYMVEPVDPGEAVLIADFMSKKQLQNQGEKS